MFKKEQLKYNDEGKAVIRQNRKIVAKIYDMKKRNSYWLKTFKKEYPGERDGFNLEMSFGLRHCKTEQECVDLINKYIYETKQSRKSVVENKITRKELKQLIESKVKQQLKEGSSENLFVLDVVGLIDVFGKNPVIEIADNKVLKEFEKRLRELIKKYNIKIQ